MTFAQGRNPLATHVSELSPSLSVAYLYNEGNN